MKSLEIRVKILSASVFALYLKTHQYHLHVKGPLFYSVHKMLDEQYKDIFDSFDTLSEQIRALDMTAPASLKEFSLLSAIADGNTSLTAIEMVKELLIDNERIIKLFSEVNELATPHLGLQNFIQGRCQEHEKYCFFLRSTIAESGE